MMNIVLIVLLGVVIFLGGYFLGWAKGYYKANKDSGVITGKAAKRFHEQIKTKIK